MAEKERKDDSNCGLRQVTKVQLGQYKLLPGLSDGSRSVFMGNSYTCLCVRYSSK